MSEQENKNVEKPNSEYGWLVRPCLQYEDEYSECTSVKGKFHQYFIFGETLDCQQWKTDFKNCLKWQNNADEEAKQRVIESEKQRRWTRLKAHYGNDTWKKRKEPPDDWNKPLPEWLIERDKNTYLNMKSEEMRGERSPEIIEKFCSIM